MKKFTKAMLITAGIFGVLGVGLSVSGAAMGATVESVELLQNLHNRVTTKSVNDLSGTAKGDLRSYTLKDVAKLDVELSYDVFIMESWDKPDFGVEVESDEKEDVVVSQRGNEVDIVSRRSGHYEGVDEARTVTFYYPENAMFREVDIEVGAGTVELADALNADDFSLSIGAGEGIGNDRITAREVSVSVGTGSLSLDVIDGQEIDGECGVGTLDIIFAGKGDEYCIEAEGGISDMTIGDAEINGVLGEHIWGDRSASRFVELECGMGSVNIDFEEE